ncbi:MAG: ABC transporter ATP-binding protein [Alphaproteobacteria bacterium]|nr:ABC transporter ATP-binding protein [Alphaproteobacteria bacterium]
MLAVAGLQVSYGSIAALRGVSLSVGSGEVVSVIGPNGAGKSTLMAAITGGVTPRGGSVVFEGTSLLSLGPKRIVQRGISLVPEGRRIFSSLTVHENLKVGASTRTDRAAIAADIERMLGHFPALRERLDRPAGRLSGGEQQQLAIARALLARPRLLLLDEPSLGLAPLVVDLVYRILARLRSEGITILLVEQNVHRALAVSDRTYVLRTGSIEMQGTSAELLQAPRFEEAYFGFAGMKRGDRGASPT